jgi:hypothetical protein
MTCDVGNEKFRLQLSRKIWTPIQGSFSADNLNFIDVLKHMDASAWQTAFPD